MRRPLRVGYYRPAARLSNRIAAATRRLGYEPLEIRNLLAVLVVAPNSDTGSIPLATPTGLGAAGGTATTSSFIGDGPFATTSGDFDFFSLNAIVGQTITASTAAQAIGSTLDTILGIFSSTGTLVAFEDDITPGLNLDSLLVYQPVVTGTYYVVVGGYDYTLANQGGVPFGPGMFPSNAQVSSSGPSRDNLDVGKYNLSIVLSTGGVGTGPVALNDSATVTQGSSVPINVLANDSDTTGTIIPSSVLVGTLPANGTVAGNATTGVLTYTPTASYFGPDSFTYTVRDSNGATSNVATVSITVNQLITKPVAVNDSVHVTENTPTVINELANDTDGSGTILPSTVAITTAPLHGTATIDPVTGKITYTPTTGYLGTDKIYYTVKDSQGLTTNPAGIIFIGVLAVPPSAINDTATVLENGTTAINVLANDIATAATLVPSSVTITSPPAHGLAVVNPNGTIQYTPTSLYFGSDSLQYQVTDTNGSVSNVAAVAITVTFVNQPPVANPDSARTNPGTPITIDVAANDTDVDDPVAPSSVAIASNPSNGTATVNSTTGAITYTPTAGFSGTDTLTYTIKDSLGATSNAATVTIHVTILPTAVPDATTTAEETPISINVLANDTPGEGTINTSSIAFTTQPANGTVAVDANTHQVIYTPNYLFFGTDTFKYTVANSFGAVSNPGVVTITVTFVNHPPVAVDDTNSTPVGTPVTTNVLLNDFDVDGSLVTSSVVIVTPPTFGSATVNANGTITYTPPAGFQGADNLTYTVMDNDGGTSNQGTLSIRVGDPVTLSGTVYVDTNNNGVQNPGELGIAGVTVTLTKNDGPVTFSVATTTDANGFYQFNESSLTGVVLAAGNYTLTETQPAFFVPGKDTAGNPPPASAVAGTHQFAGIQLAAGQAATNFNFGELGLAGPFVSAFLNNRMFFAASDGSVSNMNLNPGAVWFSFDGGAQGMLTATTTSTGAGSVQMTLYSANMQQLNTVSAAGPTTTQLSWGSGQTPAVFLKVSGTNSNVDIKTSVQALANPWQNPANVLDVNGDGVVSPLDLALLVSQLQRFGSGPVPQLLGNAAHNFLDVNGDGSITPIDLAYVVSALRPSVSASTLVSPSGAITTTDTVGANAAGTMTLSTMTSSPMTSSTMTSSTTDTGSVAFSLATTPTAATKTTTAANTDTATTTTAATSGAPATTTSAIQVAASTTTPSTRRGVNPQAADALFGFFAGSAT